MLDEFFIFDIFREYTQSGLIIENAKITISPAFKYSYLNGVLI